MTLPQNSDISSEIDYTSDTSSEDSNVYSNNSEITQIRKRVSKHKIINTKYNSSSESIKKYINNKNFEPINSNNTTTFYNMENLSDSDFNFTQIYNLLRLTTYIIFVDNHKLMKRKKYNCLSRIIKHKNNLIDTEFPGCTFLPFESVFMIKKNIDKLNNSVFTSELNGTNLYINDNICYGIMFNEGEIIKNCLYKKMEITDTIMFIPIDIYNLKQTEYKLRGFCQIVEELGAKKIEITFKTTDVNETKKQIDAKIGDDIELIAGNLGLSSDNESSKSTNYSYNLTYPTNSTIMLNEKMIKNKIKKKKFIVSDSIFKSSLELQYLVHSRCRHLIDTYSTIFTFDNANSIDKNIYLKLKTHGIYLGANFKNYSNNKNNIQIITKVTFVSLDECKNLINGNNVSLDEVGFNHIIEASKLLNESFDNNGIYKIMNFINIYVHHVLKYNNEKHYGDIIKVLTRIKKELTINEYGNLLCNYFNQDSQWIHFMNFIDLLCRKAQSYDKLGYIIMMHYVEEDKRLDNIIKFIQKICINLKLEDKFWKMLQPYSKILQNDLINKLLIEYDFTNNHSWYNMNMLIHCIETYTVNFSNNPDEKLNQLISNMEVGYKYWEFYTNMWSFILQIAKSIYYNTSDEIYISTMFEKSINIDSFMVSKINNICDLKLFIEKKINRIKEAYDIIKNIQFPIEVNELCKIFEKNNYFNKKLQSIIKTRTIFNMKKLLHLTDIVITENTAYNLIYKIITYNEKLDIKKLPKNYIGFDMILDNYNNGIQEEEFKINIIPFICSHYNNIEEVNYIKARLSINDFNIYGTSYIETIQFINKMLEEADL
jgi:hypothetical protein